MAWARFRLKKLRVLTAWIGALVLFLSARIDNASFWIGVPIAIGGGLLRIWSLGFMERKGKVLTTSGPFSYVRNPLYVGNFFIGLGILILCRNLFLLAFFLIGFTILHWALIRQEEKELGEKFGNLYTEYCKHVGRIIPTFAPFSGGGRTHFERKRLWQHREYMTFLGLAAIIAASILSLRLHLKVF